MLHILSSQQLKISYSYYAPVKTHPAPASVTIVPNVLPGYGLDSLPGSGNFSVFVVESVHEGLCGGRGGGTCTTSATVSYSLFGTALVFAEFLFLKYKVKGMMKPTTVINSTTTTKQLTMMITTVPDMSASVQVADRTIKVNLKVLAIYRLYIPLDSLLAMTSVVVSLLSTLLSSFSAKNSDML